jgi:hypothetical protein
VFTDYAFAASLSDVFPKVIHKSQSKRVELISCQSFSAMLQKQH